MGLWGQRKNLRLFKRRLLAGSCHSHHRKLHESYGSFLVFSGRYEV